MEDRENCFTMPQIKEKYPELKVRMRNLTGYQAFKRGEKRRDQERLDKLRAQEAAKRRAANIELAKARGAIQIDDEDDDY